MNLSSCLEKDGEDGGDKEKLILLKQAWRPDTGSDEPPHGGKQGTFLTKSGSPNVGEQGEPRGLEKAC